MRQRTNSIGTIANRVVDKMEEQIQEVKKEKVADPEYAKENADYKKSPAAVYDGRKKDAYLDRVRQRIGKPDLTYGGRKRQLNYRDEFEERDWGNI